MAQRLHQIQLAYKPEQDRLLLRARTSSGYEYRIWLTRRFVGRIWPLLIGALAADPGVSAQHTAESREAVLAFQHERALSRVDFSKHYHEQASVLPLGEEPILASRLDSRQGPGEAHSFAFHSSTGQSVQLRLHKGMLHALCKLLQDTTTKAEWGLDLKVIDIPALHPEPVTRVLQ